jgi:hypothetical protein
MLRITRVLLSVLTLVCLASGYVGAQSPIVCSSFSSVDLPGASLTAPNGINNAGQIVGVIRDQSFISHGFLLTGNTVTIIDVPGATTTEVVGINDSGQMVGVYGSGAYRGFIFKNGTFTYIDAPGTIGPGTQQPPPTAPHGINNAGQVVGEYSNETPPLGHGFLLSGTAFQTIDFPDANSVGGFDQTRLDGINDQGDFVGASNQSGGFVGFLNLQPIAGTMLPLGINNLGQIVGLDTFGRGFLFSGGSLVTLTLCPGNFDVVPRGISNNGQIVGTYTVAGATHGFVTCADTDGDGLCDDWETNGVTVDTPNGPVFVDLPAMGANPLRKDVFVQTDYMCFLQADSTCGPGHTHKPDSAAIAKIVEAFANAPVLNPDGSTGISLHVDCGPDCVDVTTGQPWGSLSRAKGLPHTTDLGSAITTPPPCSVEEPCYVWSDFLAIKSASFPPERAPIFHYAIFAHDLGGLGSVSGISRFPIEGLSDFIVSLGSWAGSTWQQAGTFMHELGHNLGLHHGGRNGTSDDEELYKPNYLSVMDYLFQMKGSIELDPNGNRPPGHFDYSRFALPTLNEQQLDESVGLNGGPAASNYGTFHYCPGANPSNSPLRPIDMAIYVALANDPIDWNCDGSIGTLPSPVDIDADSSSDTATGYHTLSSFDDWSHLIFRGGAIGSLGAAPAPQTSTASVQEITPQQDASITPNFGVLVSGRGIFAAAPSATINLTYTVTNQGTSADTYSLSASSTMPWADLGRVPSPVTLAPGASQRVSISVNVPVTAGTGSSAQVILKATSQTSELVMDRAEADVVVAADAIPPTTVAILSPNPNANGWNNTSVTVTLNSADNEPGGTGVKQIQWSLTGAQIGSNTVLSGTTTVTISAEGTTTLIYFGTDNAGNIETAKSITVKIDKTPPVITASANPPVLWPPNGKMVNVTVFGMMADSLSGVNPTTALFAVKDAYGLVQPAGLVNLSSNGTYSFTISLEARRNGQDMNGRLYAIMVGARDNAGNANLATTTVIVPHDQGH